MVVTVYELRFTNCEAAYTMTPPEGTEVVCGVGPITKQLRRHEIAQVLARTVEVADDAELRVGNEAAVTTVAELTPADLFSLAGLVRSRIVPFERVPITIVSEVCEKLRSFL